MARQPIRTLIPPSRIRWEFEEVFYDTSYWCEVRPDLARILTRKWHDGDLFFAVPVDSDGKWLYLYDLRAMTQQRAWGDEENGIQSREEAEESGYTCRRLRRVFVLHDSDYIAPEELLAE